MADKDVARVNLRVFHVGRSSNDGLIRKDTNAKDPFTNQYDQKAGHQKIIKPPYQPLYLARLIEVSSILRQCVYSMSTNIDSFGYELRKYPADRQQDELENTAAKTEEQTLRLFFDTPNLTQTFTHLRSEMREDYELTGNAYVELVRNKKDEIREAYLLQSPFMRVTAPDEDKTDFTERVRKLDGTYEEQARSRHFRRFVQILPRSPDKVYFKEFGDPRVISKEDGSVLGEDAPPEERATEVLWFRQVCSYSAYGLPRYTANILDIIGSRKAQEVNYSYFDSKGIPPLAIMVSGGSLTKQAIQEIKDTIENKIKGSENFHSILILDAVPVKTQDYRGDEHFSTVKVDFKPLTDAIQKDALFMNYMKSNDDAIRSAFRLSPALVGRSADHTRAAVREALRHAENQVFRPERNITDNRINRTIIADFETRYYAYKSLGPVTRDMSDVVRASGNIKDSLSYDEQRSVASELFGISMEDVEYPEGFEGLEKVPVGLISWARQQPPDSLTDDTEKFIDGLVKFQKELEKEINGRLESADVHAA